MAKKKRAFRNPNGYGSVVKLGGHRRKPFASRVTTGWSDGKQIYKYIGYYEKREDAMAALADYNRGLLNIETNKVTFKELGERWLEVGTVEMKEGSIKQYRQSFNSCEKLHDLRIVDITADAIQRLLDESGKSKNTNGQIRSFIKQVFDYAIANKVVSFSPIPYVKVRGRDKRKGIRFSDEHIQWMWDNQDKEYVDVMLLLTYTGMRITELLTLEKSAITLEGRYIIWGIKTEAGIDRTIPISKKIIPLIEKRMSGDSELLITNNKGRELTYRVFRKVFNSYLLEMNADPTHVIHDLRRTTVSMLSDAGVALPIIQKIVGHQGDNVTTQVYLDASVESLIEAIDKI